MRARLRVFAAIALTLAAASGFAQTAFQDPDFIETAIARPDGNAWSGVAGLVFAENGERAYAWERGGRVWIINESAPVSVPMLDISDEVLEWADFGMLGFALDPGFATNGYLYLFYVVDRHHLEHCTEPAAGFGPPECDALYDPTFTVTQTRATIGRITRYTADAGGAADFSQAVSVDPDSRKVLLGETPLSGVPVLHLSHGVGSLLFGTDGTLLASVGDGASFATIDVGGAAETAYAEALADGIITPKENVGAYRSQLVDSLNGKILRLDPATGAGVASNPFYNGAAPRSAASRVWALGLRNPYRMTLRPGTGSHDPMVADPGTLYLGDVGNGDWEELNVAASPGHNFGWPVFEGMTEHLDYVAAAPVNQDAAAALGCPVAFTALIAQDALSPPILTSPCSGEPIAGIPTFVHVRPELDWNHDQAETRYPAFNPGGNPIAVRVGRKIPGTNTILVDGAPFQGNASTGGVWYTGDDFPPDYHNTYFHADYGGQWIRNIVVGSDDQPSVVRPFASNAGGVIYLTTHPADGRLYYIRWASELVEVRYAPGGNLPPQAAIDASATYGASPLSVTLSGAGSTDPDGGALSFDWDFGDGSTASQAGPDPIVHDFVAPDANPLSFTVTLTVTDDGSPPLTDTAEALISVNNTPPSVLITSPPDQSLYPLTGNTIYDLTAVISDAEHAAGEIACSWVTVLHHNNHTHAGPPDTQCSSQVEITPAGCDGETYFYRVHLTATDAAGLSTTATSTLLPDCDNVPNPDPPELTTIAVLPASATATQGETRQFTAFGYDQFGAPFATGVVWTADGGGTIDATGLFTATTPGGPFAVTATDDVDGSVSGQAAITVLAANLALNQPAEASSLRFPELVAANAVDGDPATVWMSSFDTPQWLSVDLGATFPIGRVVLQWSYEWGRAYRIQVSDDGQNWIDAYLEDDGDGGTDDLRFPAKSGRYVRMYGTLSGAFSKFALREFEVYQDDGSAVPPPVPTSLLVSPPAAAVTVGASQAFVAQGYDQYGDPHETPVTWNVTGGGSIDGDGVFTATTAGGPFTVTATDADTGTLSATATVVVTVANLALGRPAVASSLRFPELVAGNAVDGDTSTVWTSFFGIPQWLYVDLGAVTTFDRVVLRWSYEWGRVYRIQVSDDALSWTDVFVEPDGDGGVDDISLPPTSARYVRMYGTQSGAFSKFSLREMEIY